MQFIYFIGLAVALFILNYLIFVPPEYGTSPVAVTVDKVRRNIEEFYSGGEGKHQLNTINKTTGDMLKTTLFAGTFISLMVIIIASKWLGSMALLMVLPAFVFGAYQTRKTLQIKFSGWQAQMCDGLTPLLEFMKSFFKLDGITTREAMEYSLEHIPEPLKSELTKTVQELTRTGDPERAFDALAEKVRHRLFYAVCFRLGVGWKNKITPNLCDDLLRQIENDKDVQIAKATAMKSGAFALICALGLLIALPIYMYPIAKYMGFTFASGVLH